MKDNISIIFTAIIGVFLIVILPLFSILDRQDSMSYNVVLTQTTKFVDNIRNNGFIDKESYYNYISALASTANTYKVDMEIYRKRLIPDTESGSDTYIEDVELFNTMDVLEVIESENSITDADKSNEKNNVYLLRENDEVYFKVYNTNMTAGSVIYNAFASTGTNKVINISYGGVVNNINWELFNKINASAIDIPEVLMEVPVNANNKTNIMKVTEENQLEPIDCDEFPELCEDGSLIYENEQYTYLYDLTYAENKKMTIAVELKNMDSIVVGENADRSLRLKDLDTLTEQEFNAAKDYIIDNFIQLNEMTADIDLKYRGKEEYYMFNIVLSNIEIYSQELLSVFASVSILPGLGQDVDGTISMGSESVRVELVDETAVHTVTISDPMNWKKLIKTGNTSEALITNGEVYVDQEIAFIVSYTGINEEYDIAAAVQNNLSIQAALYDSLEVYTSEEVEEMYGINLNTRLVGHVLVKFKYISSNTDESNYISINTGWIETIVNDEDDYIDEEYVEKPNLAYGAESSKYSVWVDSSAPIEPTILLDGIRGNNTWYIRDNINLIIQKSRTDTIIKGDRPQVGGSGVERNTLTLTGKTVLDESEITEYVIEKEGITYAIAKAYDYVGNVSSTETLTIMLDKTAPTIPSITVEGTKGKENWYTSNVTLIVYPGTDNISGVDKTTYTVNGAQNITETAISESKTIILTESGFNRIVITTYDKAGNYAEKTVDIYIDKTTPAGVDFKITSGSSNLNGWYNTDVKVNVSVKDNISPSGIEKTEYQLIGEDGGTNITRTAFTEKEKEITVTQSGRYTLKVYTYNVAGNVNVQEYKFAIDKDAPNLPTIATYSETPISNGWYKDGVRVTMISNKDVGPSTEQSFSYILTRDGISGNRTEISSPTETNLYDDGIYIYDLYSLDYASNESHVQEEIKIDKTLPISAEFVINGTKGKDNWYTSDVDISYAGGTDATSGIKEITLSQTKLTSDTPGTEITMTTEDNAGNKVINTTSIKLDKTLPTNPIINLPMVTGNGVTGVNLYNKNVDITITPGTDTYIDRTTYKVVNRQTGDEIVEETVGTALSLNENGRYEVTTCTYDKAGNRSVVSRVIWINKDKPESPKVAAIDGQTITSDTAQTVIGNNSTLNIEFTDVEVGNKLKVVLVQAGTYDKKELEIQVTDINQLVTINLESKGTYRITSTQTNMYGTESDVSIGSYDYQYE